MFSVKKSIVDDDKLSSRGPVTEIIGDDPLPVSLRHPPGETQVHGPHEEVYRVSRETLSSRRLPPRSDEET